MNLRLQEQSLKFKITSDELTTLLNGQAVKSKISSPIMSCIMCIQPDSGNIQDLSSYISTENNHTTITLNAPQKMLQQLQDMGRSRDGITAEHQGISITLQVDFRKDKSTCQHKEV